MVIKKIIWSKSARTELKNTLEFYTKRNGSSIYSLKILAQLEELLEILSKNEAIGRLSSNRKTRVLPMKVYLLLYEINGETIEIVSFWDNRQDNR